MNLSQSIIHRVDGKPLGSGSSELMGRFIFSVRSIIILRETATEAQFSDGLPPNETTS